MSIFPHRLVIPKWKIMRVGERKERENGQKMAGRDGRRGGDEEQGGKWTDKWKSKRV